MVREHRRTRTGVMLYCTCTHVVPSYTRFGGCASTRVHIIVFTLDAAEPNSSSRTQQIDSVTRRTFDNRSLNRSI